MAVRHLLDMDFIRDNVGILSYSEIATRESRRLSQQITRNVIAGVHRDLKHGVLLDVKPHYIYGKDEPQGLPIFTGQEYLYWDQVMVWNDIHGDKVDYDLLAASLDVASYYAINKLIIAGDLGDFQSLSKHSKRLPELKTNLNDELDVIENILSYADPYFNQIVLFPGNHDMWAVEQLEGKLEYNRLARLFIPDHMVNKVLVSNYDRVHLISNGVEWVIPHQIDYNQNPLVVAEKLSNKYECSVVTTHQHISATGMSKNRKHQLIDSGGLHNPDKFAYSAMRTSSRRVMMSGFTTIVSGQGKLWTPYPMTDWTEIYDD